MRLRYKMLTATLALATLAGGPCVAPTASAQGGTAITFVNSGQQLGQGVSFNPTLGDIDGDSDLDLFIPNYFTACKIWKNDGSGYFTNTGQNFGTTSGHGVDLGDLDGDGDPDAFLAFLEGSCWVLLNNGTGQFTDTGQRLGVAGDNPGFVSLADLDGDDDLDAAVLNYEHPNRIWLNDGAGVFTAGQSLGDSSSREMAVGDLDSDGDVDIFMRMGVCGCTVWLNNGSATFTDTGQRLGDTDGWGEVGVGDLDGDGDLDAFVANQAHGNSVWLNDGTGSFAAGNSYPGDGTEKLDLGDIEGDGDLDAFTTNHLVTNKVWLNDGGADFTPIDSLFGTGVASITAGDVDSDGDLDVIVGRLQGYGPTSVYFNTTPSAGVGGHGGLPAAGLLALKGPNPFDAATEISYEVPSAGQVSLKLLDVQGRAIRTLVGGPHTSGAYSIRIGGDTLAGGAYFCRLELRESSGNVVVETRKMIHIR